VADYAAFLYVQSGRVNTLVFPNDLLLNPTQADTDSMVLSDSLDTLVRRWTQEINDMSMRMIDVASASLPDFPMLAGSESQLLSIASLPMPLRDGQEQDFLIKNHLISRVPSAEGRMFSLEVNTLLLNNELADDVPLSLVQNLKSEEHAYLIAWDANGPSERVLPLEGTAQKFQRDNSIFYSTVLNKWKADDGTAVTIHASRSENEYTVSLTRDKGLRDAEIEMNMAAVFSFEGKNRAGIDISSDTVLKYRSEMSVELPSILHIPST